MAHWHQGCSLRWQEPAANLQTPDTEAPDANVPDRRQPLLLVLEDLQWIDSETQSLLDGLVRSIPASRLLLLVTYRPEYSHGWVNQSRMTSTGWARAIAKSSRFQSLHGALAALAGLKRLPPGIIDRHVQQR